MNPWRNEENSLRKRKQTELKQKKKKNIAPTQNIILMLFSIL